MAAKQTITKTALLAMLTGDLWTLISHTSWTSYVALEPTVEWRFRVVYWCAWNWRTLTELRDALKAGDLQKARALMADFPAQ